MGGDFRRGNWRSGLSEFALLCDLLAATGLAALPSPATAEKLPIRVYTIADGLPHDRINRIMRDSHGFLWFCTPGGLARFDGDRFTVYREEDGLASESVNDILEDGDVYWIATNGGGVARFDPESAAEPANDHLEDKNRARRFTIVKIGDQAATNRVNVLFKDRAHRLWAATDGGLFRFDGESRNPLFRRVPLQIPGYAETAIQVWTLMEDLRGAIWIGTSRGLVRHLPGGTTEWRPVRPAGGVDHVWTIRQDRSGRILMGHNAGLLVLTEGSRHARPAAEPPGFSDLGDTHWFTPPHGGASFRVRALYLGSDGRVWIGGDHGLAEFDGQRVRTFTADQALDAVVDAFVEDTARNLWIGSSTGAVRLARGGFTTFDQADGLSDATTPLIFETRAGELCAVSPRHIVNIFDGHGFRPVRPALPYLPNAGTFTAAVQDHLGEWWFGNGEQLYRFPAVSGVSRLAGLRWTARYGPPDGLAGGAISKLFEDSRGDIWIATRVPPREVVTRWERRTGTFHRYGPQQGLPASDPAAWFVEDRSGDVWLGFWNGSGVARYRNERFAWFPSRARSWGGTSLLLDHEGRIWIGSLGLSRVDDPSSEHPRVVEYRVPDFAPRGVVLLVQDRSGRLYFRTSEGLIRLDPRNNTIKRYTSADGLGGMEPKAGYLARDGTLWFATATGVSRFHPEPPGSRPQSAPVAIAGMRVGGIPRPIRELGAESVSGLVLQPGERQLQIDFFGMSFEGGQVLRYQYRLEGIDPWSAPTRERSVTYAHLAAGSYRFAVRALDSRGIISSRSATLDFVVRAPLWRSPWFIGLGAGIFLLVALGVYRYHVRRLLEVERVRTRIATDLHDDIGSSLSQIAILSEVAQRRGQEQPAGPMADPLAQIATTSREVVDSMGDIVWAINPARDRLSDLTQRMRRFANDVLVARGIEFTFTAPDCDADLRLGVDLRRHVFLIFKESVTNIVRHSGATRAEILLHVDRTALRLTVSDNGHGRRAFADGNVASVQGHGLAGMRARARELRGVLTIDVPPEGGLVVSLAVPLRRPPLELAARWLRHRDGARRAGSA